MLILSRFPCKYVSQGGDLVYCVSLWKVVLIFVNVEIAFFAGAIKIMLIK